MPSDPQHEAAVKRLCRLAAKIDDPTWAAGAAWYPSEAGWIAAAAQRAGAPVWNATAAYAALSPRLQLGRNRIALVAMLEGQRPSGVFTNSVNTAKRCLLDGGLPSGPKVHSFARNLLGDSEAVTVDVWAMKAAGFPGASPGTAKRYATIARTYQGAAKRLGIEPRTLQAATWLHVRGVKPTDTLEAS